MSIFRSSSRRALAAVNVSLLCLASACAAAPGDDGEDLTSDESVDVSGSSTNPLARKNKLAPAPALSAVTPSRGATAGGTAITLTGSNFQWGATVTVGGAPCTSVVRTSTTQITANTPPGTAGARDVVVTNPDGQRATRTGAFTYEAPASSTPVVTIPTGSLRGTNLVGMEGGYGFNQTNGPIPDTEYAVHSNQIVDYLAAKNVNVIRFMFSWERMQSTLNGPIPAATTGNYKAYFDDYKRIVDYATNVKGMNVIIEPWQASTSGGVGGPSWRGNVVGNGVVTTAHFADFWSKMATIYRANPRVTIGLVNEPNNMNTMTWFAAAQTTITAIRNTGFSGDIHVPGNGWTGAGSWNDTWYDKGYPQRSNAYGWLNARGPGLPLTDPLDKLVVGVHTYADADASGSTASVVSSTISRTRVKVTVDWARANGLKVFVGEIGMYAAATNATANWTDFVSYVNESSDTLTGFAWWACGKPGWWNDVAANGGGHYSITPTSSYTVDTVNMNMIEGSFLQ
jgi:endoglucanase